MMGSYSHAVKSALDQGPISDHNFYRQDEVKYHGNRNRGVHSVTFVSVDEQFQNIRPLPRFRQPDPSSLQHPVAAVHDPSAHAAEVPKATQAVSLPTTITSERSSSISADTIRQPPLAKFHLNSETEPTVKEESLFIQSEPVLEPKPELELEPKLNSREIDYLYFDNGSLTLSTFQL
ncbi:hypothetical protein WUBG_16476, partial [Wuchereria bancrofti]